VQTSHFQLGLIAILALGLGLTLSSSSALGYPAGVAVSTGTNPVTSGGGQFDVDYGGSASGSLVAAPSDHDLVITDLHLGALTNRMQCLESWEVSLVSDGETLASYGVYSGHLRTEHSSTGYSAYSTSNTNAGYDVQLSSGIRIEAGQTATLEVSSFTTYGSCSSSRAGKLIWTYAGYYAQP